MGSNITTEPLADAPGIYSITNTANGKVYVGCSGKKGVRHRIGQHRSALRNNKHKNRFLQASWNEHGEAAFQFAVLELCSLRKRGGRHVRKDVQNLNSRERFWIDTFGSWKTSRGFNIEPFNVVDIVYPFLVLEELLTSKGLNLEELLRSKDQNRLDKQTRLDLEKELAARIKFHGPKPRSKAAAARQDADRLKAASQTFDEVMSLNLDWLMDLNAFHSARVHKSFGSIAFLLRGSRNTRFVIVKP